MTEKTKRSEHNRLYKIKEIAGSALETAKNHKIETTVVAAIAMIYIANNMDQFDAMRGTLGYAAYNIQGLIESVLTGGEMAEFHYSNLENHGIAWVLGQADLLNQRFLQHARVAAFLVTLIYLVKATFRNQEIAHTGQTHDSYEGGIEDELQVDDDELVKVRQKLADFAEEIEASDEQPQGTAEQRLAMK